MGKKQGTDLQDHPCSYSLPTFAIQDGPSPLDCANPRRRGSIDMIISKAAVSQHLLCFSNMLRCIPFVCSSRKCASSVRMLVSSKVLAAFLCPHCCLEDLKGCVPCKSCAC